LFQLVRDAIGANLRSEPPPDLPPGAALARKRGVFVTLREPDGKLRGCIGHTEPWSTIAEAVRSLAVSAAFGDQRFPPVTADEAPGLRIELSLLSELSPADPNAIEIGVHGLVIRHDGHSGLLLPQVASERGWTVDVFLAQTCRKAELPADAWKQPAAKLLWFTCDKYEA
jgi:AmmeMemoRadiSam system protein A